MDLNLNKTQTKWLSDFFKIISSGWFAAIFVSTPDSVSVYLRYFVFSVLSFFAGLLLLKDFDDYEQH